MKRLTIGLTGGIASGKTLASTQMEMAGFKTVDADVIARKVVEKGTTTLSLLVNEFGTQILTNEGHLNRNLLKKMVFNDAEKLKRLNQIVHPSVQEAILAELSKSKESVVVLVIPLFNKSMIDLYSIDRVLVVDVSEQVQRKRVMDRDGVDADLANRIISSQISRENRLLMASDVIGNNGSMSVFKVGMKQMIKFYATLLKS